MQEIKITSIRPFFSESGLPQQVLRFRWRIDYLDGNSAISEWTPGRWPSWTETWTKNKHAALAVSIEAQPLHTGDEHFRMGLFPATLVLGVEFMALQSAMGVGYVAGLVVKTTEASFTFLCNGAINEEKVQV
jgi:hypothetical protein